jgi:hypothetical protein
MGWAAPYIQQLLTGQTVQFRPRGHSMTGRIDSGQLCTVVPIADPKTLKVGDIVLCKVRGSEYLHLITAARGCQYQISNNKGHVNGWVTPRTIYGLCVKVEP